MIKLGIDNGNYNTKSSEGMLYASGFAVSDREFITPELQLYYEGNYYAIGERRLRFQQDKTREQDLYSHPAGHCRGHEAFRSGQRGYYAGGGASH